MVNQGIPDKSVLTLKEAAARLGVHPATLRRWADQGEIQVVYTPGGHRRFPESEVARLEKPSVPAMRSPHQPQESLTSQAISLTRTGLEDHRNARWISELSEEEREENRLLGRRLVGLMMQYISSEDDGEALIQEGQVIARIYAKSARNAGLELSEALKATMFFRDNLVETAVVLPEATRKRPEANHRLYRRINDFLNAVQLAIAQTYESQREREDDIS